MSEYRLTEEKAWERLQRDLLYLRLKGESGKGQLALPPGTRADSSDATGAASSTRGGER